MFGMRSFSAVVIVMTTRSLYDLIGVFVAMTTLPSTASAAAAVVVVVVVVVVVIVYHSLGGYLFAL